MPQKSFFAGKLLCVSDSVYAPAEDSFLLAEAVCAEKRAASAKFALDLGTGSGIQAINLCLLGVKKVVAADINGDALHDARVNAKRFGFSRRIKTVRSDMFSALVREKFDIIVFNPPYVPGDALPRKPGTGRGSANQAGAPGGSSGAAHAHGGSAVLTDVDGGRRGRDVLGRFLTQFGKHLNPGGVCYFMQSSINGTRATERTLKARGFAFAIAAHRRLFFEELLVYRCVHAD